MLWGHDGHHTDATVPGALHIGLGYSANLGQELHLQGQGPGGALVDGGEAGWDDASGVLGAPTTGDVGDGMKFGIERLMKSQAIQGIDLGGSEKNFTGRFFEFLDLVIQ